MMSMIQPLARVIACAAATAVLLSSAPAARGRQAVRSSPPAPPPAGSTTRDPVVGDYRLGPGDKLRVEVYKDPQLSQSVQIRPDGKITMPLVGDVPAVGFTSIELRDRIAALLKDYVNNPVVTVIVVEAIASNVYVMGEVNKPGPVPLAGPMTVLQALAMSGGFKDFANTSDIRVLRRSATGVETIRFNYRDAVKGHGAPVFLRSGDTIIVP
jgi:polysaccharide biosynthesis/export protein